MESGLKQRLVGAAVLVALAVIFLPMLVKGPAPDSGISDVPLKMPDAPQGDMQTRDLPLLAPEPAPQGGAVGMQATPAPADGDALPMVDTTAASSSASQAVPLGADAGATQATASGPMLPATAAGGDYAVHFGVYASNVSADTVISRLRGAHLPAYREAANLDGKSAWRVRIGPYATRADAEIARIEAAKVGNQSGVRVVALDADVAAPASVSQPVAGSSLPAIASEPLPAPAKPAAKPADAVAVKPAVAKPATPKPADVVAAKPAATGVGFAVQIGAFGNAAQANAKRDQLRAAGFAAFTDTVATDKGTLTRVKAGPVVARADADRLKAQIKSKTGMDGIVRPHP
jgi:cell division septation protein DedD